MFRVRPTPDFDRAIAALHRQSPPARTHRLRPVVAAVTTISLTVLAACSSSSGSPSSSSTTSNRSASQPSGAPGGSHASSSVTAAPETNAPGDIPDTIAYITYANPAGHYQFDHPEGWAQTNQGTAVQFTDKFNGVSADTASGANTPTPASAEAADIPPLRQTRPAFELVKVEPTNIPAGSGVHIVYRTNSSPDPVTGKSVRQEVQLYEIQGGGHVVTFELFGAVGADNVDPYARMVQSLRIS